MASKRADKSSGEGKVMDENQFKAWKTQLTPLLYDWFGNHHLQWPTQAVRWGPKLDDQLFKSKYRVYLSEQTDTTTKDPPKLLVYDLDICKPRVASSETVASWADFEKCPFIKLHKTIIHPGEVNKIRELPQHPGVVVTHTDAPELYVWNLDKQPHVPKNSDKDRKTPPTSVAECVLVGHKDEAQFPLATSSAAPAVASGGTDKHVLLWRLDDAMDGILAGKRGSSNASTTHLKQRNKFEGHKETVEDVVFEPGSADCLVSVGDDRQILFWDARSGSSPVLAVKAAHGDKTDIHCVDWSSLDPHLVATGAADGSLKVWDRRSLTGGSSKPVPLHSFHSHSQAIMRVEWHPELKGVLASGGEDHLILVWNLGRTSMPGSAPSAPPAAAADAGSSKSAAVAKGPPPELLFKHVGHRHGKVVDFQWCPSDPWTMLSVSDDLATGEGGSSSTSGDGGGTLQVWRINDLIYRPEDEVVAELETHRDWILQGKDPPSKDQVRSAAPTAADAGKAAAASGSGAGATMAAGGAAEPMAVDGPTEAAGGT